jgi:hypothetical protein
MVPNTIALSRFTSRAYRRAPHRPARVVSSPERVSETNNDLYQGLNKIMKNDLQSIHEQYKRIISEANEEPRYNNGMDEDYVYPNKEEARQACLKFNDEFQALMSKYGVHMTGDDSSSFEYATAHYYDEGGNIKKYVLY